MLLPRLAVVASLVTAVLGGECSATKPCAIGCCSKYGNCGLGPDYCAAANCVSSCDNKAECDPGGWGLTYANATACPLNVCCSAYGFCGTTSEFCGTSKVTAPSCAASSSGSGSIGRVVGYYESWAETERLCNVMHPEQIPQGIYTHINFAFASIDPTSFEVVPSARGDEDLYNRLQSIQTRDLGLQTWIALGGWTFNDDDQPTRTTFSDLAASAAHQEVFFASLLQFMQTYGFTGVDLDWEYPEAPDRSGRGEDFANFPVLLQRLRGALDAYGFGLSVTLPSSYWYLQHFDLKRLQPWVDWFNVMEYDLHGTWDIGNQWTGAYLNAHTNLTEIRDSFDLLWRNGVDPAKINLGLAMYGRSTTVASAACTAPGCPYVSGGDAGSCSGQTGILLNSEIEQIVAANGLQPTLHTDAAVKTITWGDNQWVSYDDADTWKIKGDYAKSVCLGGVMVWAVSHDDTRGTYANQLAGALGRDVFIDPDTNLTAVVTTGFSQVGTCQWTNCGEGCPTGFAEAPDADGLGGSLTDATGCFGNNVHTFCCPKTAPLPTCAVRGFQDSGVCVPGCASGEAEVGQQSTGCSSGYRSVCCTAGSSSMAPYGACAWFGAPPLCAGAGSVAACPSSHPNRVVSSTSGQGGAGSCWVGAMSYCCAGSAAPGPFTHCAWSTKASHAIAAAAVCEDGCPSGELLVARQQGTCVLGSEAYCCKGPSVNAVGGLGSIGTLGLEVGSSDTTLATLASSDLAVQTANTLETCLTEFFLSGSPTCPALMESSLDQKIYGTVSRRRVGVSRFYNYDCIVGIMSAEMASPHPSEEVAAAWNLFQDKTGVGYPELYNYIYPFNDGVMTEDPRAVVGEYLCNPLKQEKTMIQGVETAQAAFCEFPGTGGYLDPTPDAAAAAKRDLAAANRTGLSSRKIQLDGDDNRDPFNLRPTVIGVLRAINDGTLGIYYLRWINWRDRREILLEVAYTAADSLRNDGDPSSHYLPEALQDATHIGSNLDHYIVFHLHIPIDGLTLLSEDVGGQQDWFVGVSALNMYHGQWVGIENAPGYDTEDPAPRVNWQDNRGVNPVNARTVALTCPTPAGGPTNRWYLGRDRSDAILAADTGNDARRYNTYAEALNTWALNLYNNGAFSTRSATSAPGNLNYLWPRVSRTPNTGPGPYNPEWGAFDENWTPFWP